MSLDEVTSRLGEAYNNWREAAKLRDEIRKEFFQAATDELAQNLQERHTIEVLAEDEEQALRVAQAKFPDYKIIEANEADPIPETDHLPGKVWEIIIEDNPALQPYSYVNKEDGNVYQKSIVEGSPSLDDESLLRERPDLWEAITVEVSTRILRPMEELSPEQLRDLQPYLVMPSPRLMMPAPRKAKEEELEQ